MEIFKKMAGIDSEECSEMRKSGTNVNTFRDSEADNVALRVATATSGCVSCFL